MNVIALCNQKGGVGKTTSAVNIGSALQIMGKKVLLIDLDPQANLSSYLGFENDDKPTITHLMMSAVTGQKVDVSDTIRHNEMNKLDFIPSDIMLSNAEVILIQAISREQVLSRILRNPIFHNYDYILIDCLPSLGVLLTNALAAANGLIIPVQVQKFALDGLQSLTDIFEKIKTTINEDLELIGVLPTMVDSTNMSKNTTAALAERYGDKMFKTTISKSVEAANSSEKMIALPLTKHKLGKEYTELAKEVVARCG